MIFGVWGLGRVRGELILASPSVWSRMTSTCYSSRAGECTLYMHLLERPLVGRYVVFLGELWWRMVLLS